MCALAVRRAVGGADQAAAPTAEPAGMATRWASLTVPPSTGVNVIMRRLGWRAGPAGATVKRAVTARKVADDRVAGGAAGLTRLPPSLPVATCPGCRLPELTMMPF